MFRKFAFVVAAGSMLSGAAFAQTIKIGLSGPFTGSSAAMGTSMRDGVKLAVSEINQAGGIMGKQITLVERDDEARAELGVRIAHELIDKEHVVATLGYVDTDVALAAQRFYEDAEIPVLNNVASGTSISRQFPSPDYKANYIFQTSINDAIQAGLIVHEAIVRLKFKAPAIMADSTNYGELGRTDLKQALAAVGVTPAAEESFNVGDTDMNTQLSRVKGSQADVLLAYGSSLDLARIANGMATLGWKLPIIGNRNLSTSTFILNTRANGDGASMPQTFIQTGNTEKRAAFIAAYRRVYRVTRIDSPDSAAQGYDSVWLLKAAIEQVRSTDGPRIRAALENLRTKVEGVVTIYDRPFSVTDHEAITANIPVFGIVRNGHVVAAHEEDLSAERAMRLKQ